MKKLFSRYFYDDLNVERLTTASLSELAEKADKIRIVSAYYSNSFFINFFARIPKTGRKKCNIILILNGFAGFRLKNQSDELAELEIKLRDFGFENIQIYLNVKTSLFHSKLYCFHTDTGVHWFIGSANASEAAFTQNEEILFHFTNEDSAFQVYLEQVVKSSIDYRIIEEMAVDTIIKFWRTGLIYYKPNAIIQFTFSRLMIPSWVKQELTQNQSPPPYANPGEPWGPFNLKLALGFKDEDEKIQARHVSWSIETCFGYWVPSIYKQKLDEKISEVSKRKNIVFRNIVSKIEEYGNENLAKKFEEYILSVKSKLDTIYSSYKWEKNDRIVVKIDDEYYIGTITKIKQINIDIQFDDGDFLTRRKDHLSIAGVGKRRKRKSAIPENEKNNWLIKAFWRPQENLSDQFQTFVDKLIRRLKDENHMERASSPLISSTMPEIWSDPIALDEFSESFFEYVSFRLNLPKKPLVIKSLQQNCDLEESDTWEDIKRKIEKHIIDHGWGVDDWLK